MKKITLLFLALIGMLANAQQTLYDENFESNVVAGDQTFAPTTKATKWSGGVDLTTPGDTDITLRQGWGAQYLLKILSTGTASVTIPNIPLASSDNLMLSYNFVLENAGGGASPASDVTPFIEASIDGGTTWVTLNTVASGGDYNNQNKMVALPVGTYTAISLRMNRNVIANSSNSTIYDAMFDDFVITGDAGILYSENFEADFNPVQTFAPSTKVGTWSGGIDLTTPNNENITLRDGWGSQLLLKILSTGAAVTIPNIPVAGYTNLSLSYEFVVENAGVAVAPNIEASVDGGANWTTLPTVASGGGYNKETKSVALPAGTYNAISLRMNPDTVNSSDVMFDNFRITGTAVSLGTNSNQLSDNSIKVYPNPFVNEFKVDATNSEGPLQVSVFDVLGKKVATAKSSSNQLSMGSSLSSGVYVVKVEGANAKDSKSFKIIKK